MKTEEVRNEEVRNKVKSLLEELTNDFYNGRVLQAYFSVKNVADEWIADKRLHDLNDRIDEVRSDYVDDDGCVVIDVWLHNYESGFSVARIHEDKTVEWTNTTYKDCQKIMEVIKEITES